MAEKTVTVCTMKDEFLKYFKVSRAVCWNNAAGVFCPRSYSATVVAAKTQDLFNKIKESH